MTPTIPAETRDVIVAYKHDRTTVRVTATRNMMADAAKTKASLEHDWPFSEIVIVSGRLVESGVLNG